MPTDLTIDVDLNGASTTKGAIGPRDFARKLLQMGQFQELEVTILPADVDKIVPLPTIAAPKFLFIKTDLPCSFKKGVESIVHALDVYGMHMEAGALVAFTQLSFTGAGAPQANVYIAVGGT